MPLREVPLRRIGLEMALGEAPPDPSIELSGSRRCVVAAPHRDRAAIDGAKRPKPPPTLHAPAAGTIGGQGAEPRCPEP